MAGMAADFYAAGVELDELGGIVKGTAESLPVAQVINEFGQWIHVALEPYGRTPTRRYLVAAREGGRTVYRDWI
jgi:hypothetical protein